MHKNYHFIGIGGIGMSALANILLQKGIKVSGSDLSPSYLTENLQKQGAEIYFCHARENIPSTGAVVYSTDIKGGNPEVEQAKQFGLPFLHRSELLCDLMLDSQALLVAGTHGKTTTSSLLSHLLIAANLSPSFAIGGIVKTLDGNGGYGKGPYFVAEADESDGTFLKYHPFGAIITNIDNDHLDHWKNFDTLIDGFRQFAKQVVSPEHLFWCGDDEVLQSLKLPGFSYGFSDHNALQVENFRQEGWKNVFDLFFDGNRYAEVEIPLVGAHNVLNAAAVFGLGLSIGLTEGEIRQGFHKFKGVSRRAELKGDADGITVIDDYAHHPTELFATLRGVKQAIGKRRLVAAFQPHRYTRTRDCLNEFAAAFERADALILTDIYAAREEPIEGITTSVLMAKIRESYFGEVHYVPRAELAPFLSRFLHTEDVLLTLGAGDITQVGPEVLNMLMHEK